MNVARFPALVVALLALCGGKASGQFVSGTLRDAGSGEAISTVRVDLVDEGGWTKASVLTDEAGNYRIRVPARGGYWLRAERIGYRPLDTRPFVVGRDESVALDLAMTPQAAAVEGVTVTATRRQRRNYAAFLERQRWGWGRYLGPEDIARRAAGRASQLLMGLPGVSVGGTGGVRLTGRGANCAPTVYVDGLRVPPEDGEARVDLMVPGSEVRAVEVYRSPMFAPVEWQFSSGGCGIVVLWTDYGLGV